MPEPISLIAAGCVGGYALLQATARGGSAVSREAQSLRYAATQVVDATERSQALFGEKADAISQIWEIHADCAAENWDESDAAPISLFSAVAAQEFIRALPEGIPVPEFAPEPDGALSLDWIESRHRMFSLSIGNSDRLAYAWLDGTDRGHGVAQFDGTKVPSRILEGIQSIMNHGDASLRAS